MRKLLESLGEMRRLQMALWIVASVALLLALGVDWWRSLERGDALEESAVSPELAAAKSSVGRSTRPRGERRVVVRVIDAGGEPVRGARVYAPRPGGAGTSAVEFEPGRHAFSGLEEGEVEIVVELAGDRIRFQHATDKGNAVIPVPTGGRVAVAWALPAHLDLAQGRVMLALEPASSSTDRFEVPVPPGAGNRGSLMVPYVVPGSYLAHLEFWREAGRPEDTAVVIPLTAPIELAVEPRALTRIALGLNSPDSPPPPARPSPAPGPAPSKAAPAPAPGKAAPPGGSAPASRDPQS
jgi:hypothetical protein